MTRRVVVTIVAVLAVLLVCGAVVVTWAVDQFVSRSYQRVAAAMPAGWGTILRQRTTVPDEVRQLAVARTDTGNGAVILYDTTRGSWQRLRLDSTFAYLSTGRATAGDSLAFREVEADTVLDRWARHARRAEWSSVELMLANSDSIARHNLMALRAPDYRRAIHAIETLALRGWLRADRGNRAGARADLAAVMALGEQLARHEPTLDGLIAGRLVLHRGAEALRRLGQVSRDTALVRRAQAVVDWSQASTADDYDVLRAVPDSALAFAGDSALAAGWRTAALLGLMSGELRRPRGILFGLPQATEDAITRTAAQSDPAFRPLAELAARTAQWLDGITPFERWQRFAGPGTGL